MAQGNYCLARFVGKALGLLGEYAIRCKNSGCIANAAAIASRAKGLAAGAWNKRGFGKAREFWLMGKEVYGQRMNCLCCGRALKSARSRELGYGPVCYRRLSGGSAALGKQHPRHADAPGCQGIPGQMSMDDFLRGPSRQQGKESAFATLQ